MYTEDLPPETNEYLTELSVHILTAVCTILSVIGVFSGSAVCREIQLKKSTLYHRFLPFLTSQIYNLIWFYYGLLKLDWTIMVSHTIGCTMQTFYMIVYIQYANPVPLMHICSAWSILFLGWFHLNIVIGTRDKVISRLGFIGALSLALNYLASIIDFIALECNKKQYLNSKLYTANLLNEQVRNQVQTNQVQTALSKSSTSLEPISDKNIGSNNKNTNTDPALAPAPIILNEYYLQQKEFDQNVMSKQNQILTKNDKSLLSPSEQNNFLFQTLPKENSNFLFSNNLPKFLNKFTSNFINKLKTFESYNFDDDYDFSSSLNLKQNGNSSLNCRIRNSNSECKSIQVGASLLSQNSVTGEEDGISSKQKEIKENTSTSTDDQDRDRRTDISLKSDIL